MDLTEFNLDRQYQGNTLRDGASALCGLFWRGYWPWQKKDAEFALINTKVPVSGGVFVYSFILNVRYQSRLFLLYNS